MEINEIKTTLFSIIETEGGEVLHAMKKSDQGFSGFGEAYFSSINPGAIKFAKSKPLIEFIDLPRARLKTARKSKELIAGPIIVWIPTFRNLKTSFLIKDQRER